jgi:hypothetical protein
MLQVFVGWFFYFVKNLQFRFDGTFQNSRTLDSSSLIFFNYENLPFQGFQNCDEEN